MSFITFVRRGWYSLEVTFNDEADDPVSSQTFHDRKPDSLCGHRAPYPPNVALPIPPSSIALLLVVSSNLHDFKPTTNDVKNPTTTKHPVSRRHAQPQNETLTSSPNPPISNIELVNNNDELDQAQQGPQHIDDDGGEEIDGTWEINRP
ncbi:hypothetical protein D9611_012596 [Ephemerocybe angulata]|uniref:Uncharacterized protein n=1 Tax=Ephemerocybe angulata TaxID=980116 RepID=A0A8H5AUX8_9AGAR|nr:hypothetical protein D9611_012596 [Tulosesus angulatus]